MAWLDEIAFDDRGLVPVVTQEASSGEILMLAYADREALELTRTTHRAHYWSRSRAEIWRKGDTSGHIQELVEIRIDCDADAVLYRVRQTGPACHTGARSCFSRAVGEAGLEEAAGPAAHILARVAGVVAERERQRPADSYTTYLFESGVDKILKKVGEEATEVVIAAKNDSAEELSSEVGDLFFHLLVLLHERKLPLDAVWEELEDRFGQAPRPGTTQEERNTGS